MSKASTHPTDTTLLMALDREIPPPRLEALHQHLIACDGCRSRLTAFEAAAADSAHLCHGVAPAEAATIGVLRARLQQRMREVGDEWDRSLLFRVRRSVSSVPLIARFGMSVALLVVLVRFVRPVGLAEPTFPPRTESLPVSLLTPGAIADITAADLCSGAAPRRTGVPAAVRQQVLRQYRMEHVPASEYELDYLITPELGGVADARNLWPERYESGPWNAHIKDDLERLLSRQVCSGSIDLAHAQHEIASNWIDAYKKHFNTDRPIPRHAGIEDDDDEIQFESPGTVSDGARAVVSFAPRGPAGPRRHPYVSISSMTRSRISSRIRRTSSSG